MTLLLLPLGIQLEGIPSEEAFGTLNFHEPGPPQTLFLDSIMSEEAFGDLEALQLVHLTGIPSEEAFGSLTNSTFIHLQGIYSEELVTKLVAFSIGFVPTGDEFKDLEFGRSTTPLNPHDSRRL